MNDYIVSVLLGIVEGLTEFLPVSSTAHLRIAEALLHVSLTDPYWKMYTIVIQLGAILALVLLYLNRIVTFIHTFPKGEGRDHALLTHPITLVTVAFVCTAVPSLIFEKAIGKHLENIMVIALSMLIGGIVMWAVDFWSSRRESPIKDIDQMGMGQAVWIGLCQVLSAVFPGTSRSMSTIAAGQIVGMTRTAALEFSFLVSIPVMIAATGYDLLKALHPSHEAQHEATIASGLTAARENLTSQGFIAHIAIPQQFAPVHVDAHGWIVLSIGFSISFFVALIVVGWFLQFVRKHGFTIFAIYRIILGVVLLVVGKRLFAA